MPDDTGGKISAFGVAIDGVPKWAIVLALAFGIGVAISVYIRRPEQMNTLLRQEVTELGAHIGEDAEFRATILDDARGRQLISRYQDLCVVLTHRPSGSTRPRYRLIVHMGGDDDHASRWFDAPVVEAAAAQLNGGCHGHSDGPVRTWEDTPNRCITQVHREWRDGCHVVQVVDTCHGTQDIKWVRCVR